MEPELGDFQFRQRYKEEYVQLYYGVRWATDDTVDLETLEIPKGFTFCEQRLYKYLLKINKNLSKMWNDQLRCRYDRLYTGNDYG